MKRMTITAIATTILGLGALAAPANAAAGDPTATFTGTCTNWSVTFAAGDTARHFQVTAGAIGDIVIDETLPAGGVDTLTYHFKNDGVPKVGVVTADGVGIAGRYFRCGYESPSAHRHQR